MRNFYDWFPTHKGIAIRKVVYCCAGCVHVVDCVQVVEVIEVVEVVPVLL